MGCDFDPHSTDCVCDSTPLASLSPSASSSSATSSTPATTTTTVREDGRTALQLRAVEVHLRPLHSVDGSARLLINGVCEMLAGASGPISTRKRHEEPDRSILEVNVRPVWAIPAARLHLETAARLLKGLLQTVLLSRMHPRCRFVVTVQEIIRETEPPPRLSPSGRLGPTPSPNSLAWEMSASTLAMAMNASVLALIDSGTCPMSGVPIAIAVAASASARDVLLLDPTAREEREARAVFLFGFVCKQEPPSERKNDEGEGDNDSPVLAQCYGNFDAEMFQAAAEVGKGGANLLMEVWRRAFDQKKWVTV